MNKPIIVAVDFDGVLCVNEFPEIGPPQYEVISLVRQLIDAGCEVVLWTTRSGEELTAAVDWCGDRGLHFSNVNGPAPSNEEEYRGKYATQSRKIYADAYIDDHNVEYVGAGRDAGYNNMIRYIKSLKGRKGRK